MNKEYSIQTKDRILNELMQFIKNDSGWLTPNDQHAIESRIDQLKLYINERYEQHGR